MAYLTLLYILDTQLTSSCFIMFFYRMSQLEDYSRIQQSSVVNETAMQQRSLRSPNGLYNGIEERTQKNLLSEEQPETEDEETEEAKESIQPILRRQDNVTSGPTPRK